MRKLFTLLFTLLAWPVGAQTISPTLDTKIHWDNQWEVGTGVFCASGEVQLGYHRSVVKPNTVGYVAETVTAFALESTDSVVIFGTGLGFFEEHLREKHDFTDVVSVDPSAWIQSAKTLTEDDDFDSQCVWCGFKPISQECRDLKGQLGDGGFRSRVAVLSEDMATIASRNTVKQALVGNVDAVLTDFILPYLTDGEAETVSTNGNVVSANVFHTVNEGIDGRSLADWKALLPADVFFDVGSGQTQ